MMNEKSNTGYNPNYSNFIGTADEKAFFETSSPNDSLASIIKDENLIVEEPIYLVQDIYISEEGISEE